MARRTFHCPTCDTAAIGDVVRDEGGRALVCRCCGFRKPVRAFKRRSAKLADQDARTQALLAELLATPTKV